MNVLAFLGSPRKGGNTEVLLEAVLEGVREAGGQPEIIRICDLAFSPCISCGYCDETGECIVEDDMTGLYDKIVASPRLILASPIYFYGITAQAKALLDRTQALWNRRRLAQEEGSWQEDPDRKGLFLSVAATKGAKVFEGAVLTAKYGFDAMWATYDQELLVRGIDQVGEMARAETILAQARTLGREFV